jgi:hypothetical protein
MASIEPVTEQPEPVIEQPEPVIEQPEQDVVDVAPPTEGVPPSASGAWSSGLCGCCDDKGSCKYFISFQYVIISTRWGGGATLCIRGMRALDRM